MQLRQRPRVLRKKALEVRIGELETERVVDTLARWRHPWHLSPDYARSRRVFERMKALGTRFQEQFGDNFVGIQVMGSRTKGYATKKSDLEYRIIFKEQPGGSDWNRVLRATRTARAALAKERIKKDPGIQSLVFLDDVNAHPEENISIISDVFSGAWVSSPGKEKARQAIIQTIDKHPFGRSIWRLANAQADVHARLKDFPGFVGIENVQRIDASRKLMGLPSFEEMRRLYLRPRK